MRLLIWVITWVRERFDRRKHSRARGEHLWAPYGSQKVCAYCDTPMTSRNRHERCRSNTFFRVYLGGRPQ